MSLLDNETSFLTNHYVVWAPFDQSETGKVINRPFLTELDTVTFPTSQPLVSRPLSQLEHYTFLITLVGRSLRLLPPILNMQPRYGPRSFGPSNFEAEARLDRMRGKGALIASLYLYDHGGFSASVCWHKPAGQHENISVGWKIFHDPQAASSRAHHVIEPLVQMNKIIKHLNDQLEDIPRWKCSRLYR